MKHKIDLSILDLLDPPVTQHVFELHRRLTEHGFQCHLVGGCVRDLLLGRKVQDVDITTNARPEEVIRIFPRTVPTGLQHGTVTVLLDSHPYEVTTYRTESEYTDGRRPDRIEYAATLEEDLSRRDFTINALALEPATGELVDVFEGQLDLRRGLIRTIGRPEDRFFEDGLRPVRACRFRATLGFQIDPETHEAMLREDVRSRMKGVAIERFADELWKGLRSARPSPMFQALQEADILSIFLPYAKSMPQSFLEALDAFDDAVFRMALWLDRACLEPERCARHLRLSGAVTKRIVLYSALFRQLEESDTVNALWEGPSDRFLAAWRNLLGRFKKDLGGEGQPAASSTEAFLEAARPCITATASPPGSAQLSPQTEALTDRLQQHYRWMQAALKSEPLLVTDLAINGRDLQGLGLKGPEIGAMLKHLLELVYVDPKRNTRDWLLSEVHRQRKS